MTFLVASFGTITLASYGIGVRILSFIIIPTLGLSMATSTLVGQNIGAGKTERAEKIVKLSLLVGFVALTINNFTQKSSRQKLYRTYSEKICLYSNRSAEQSDCLKP